MSIKKLIAALLCGIMLTGCATDAPTESDLTVTPATTAVTPATTTTAATTKATTTARTTAATTEKYTLSTPSISWVDTSNIEYGLGTFIFINESTPNVYKPNSDIVHDVYISEYEGGPKYILTEGISGDFHPAPGLQQGCTYYLYVKGYDRENNVESAISAPYTLYIEQPKPQVHQYTHTFSAPFGVTIIPLYDSANDELSRGIQPTQFEYTYTFVCPVCGKRRDGYAVLARYLPYDRDGQDIWFSTSCLYCDYDASGTVYSYASQIS